MTQGCLVQFLALKMKCISKDLTYSPVLTSQLSVLSNVDTGDPIKAARAKRLTAEGVFVKCMFNLFTGTGTFPLILSSSPSQQPSHSSLIIPEESEQYPRCTGVSRTGPPIAPYRAERTHFHNIDGG